MPPVFALRSDSNKIDVTHPQTLGELLDTNGLSGRLNDVALYNWGTLVPVEINRALVELVGCARPETDPLASLLDPALGPKPFIHKPEPWKPAAPLALDTEHTVQVRRRFPAPAVSIRKLTRWFLPSSGTCEAEYVLEGVASSADKVDFEVHAHGYHSLSPQGGQVACDTDATEAGSTHLLRRRKCYEVADRRPPAVAQKLPDWKGESEATQGVLKREGTGTFIHHGCAPYDVLVRYYKDDRDNAAKILLAPFAPRWKPVKGADPELDEDTLSVSWELQGDHGKLKRGQLVVWDKDDNVVFFAPLDEQQLRTRKRYEFLKDARKTWDKAAIRRDQLPYRVQLQAHSDEDEPLGLALAVMPTQVRAFDYAQVQFIAFNVKPGTKPRVPGPGIDYLGDADPDVDIQKRCDVMKDAIRLAAADGHVRPEENVLKLFMAPEFYFRGKDGGYPVEKLWDVTRQLRQETDKPEYADWLFVFGSAIGYLPHEELDAVTGAPTGTPLTHGGEGQVHAVLLDADTTGVDDVLTVTLSRPPDTTWKVRGVGKNHALKGVATTLTPDEYQLTVDGKSGLAPGPVVLSEPVAWIDTVDQTGACTEVVVNSRVCSRIFIPSSGAAPAAPWKLRTGPEEDDIKGCVPLGAGRYRLTLANKKAGFASGSAELVEPKSTEIFNVVMVQKGWPAPLLSQGLKGAAVYKEYVSAIDFVGPNSHNANAWFDATGLGRRIEVHGATDRLALPTEGSTDVPAASPNRVGLGATWLNRPNRVGSEINLSGDGGGSVVTVDGVTLGLEVCLDHAMNRLDLFYHGGNSPVPPFGPQAPGAVAGDPRVQVQLIPSFGMSIGRGKLCTWKGAPRPGLVFNVDGQRCASVARVTDGAYSCDDHPAMHATVPGLCTHDKELRWCVGCNKTRSAPGDCPTHGPTEARHLCGYAWQRWQCGVGGCTNTMPCLVHPYPPAPPPLGFNWCLKCSKEFPMGPPCPTCGGPPAPCPESYKVGTTCSKHAPALPQRCNAPLVSMGQSIATVGGPTQVNSSHDPAFFDEGGHVLVYPAQVLPRPDVF
ncbi:hypothetical protein BHS09_31310 [Myxococcus xanthus]|uniref:Uncharacterized protein n=1 Tax=Myxococcus xanthus TaxID=34 RepID=A0AAE6KVC0_MYXXA|nr:hypothetical protein [Myxococcus xanthus]QDE71106.1 hypothetical protein BHS09_31310 [Myxococcus xanthus]QDE78386.1 hypothetical protein BHS08_31330 [Myxococcus xanthus]